MTQLKSLADAPGTSREYETIYILRPNLSNDEVAEVNNRIKKTFGLLESDFDNSQLDRMQKLGTTLSTLERQKTILESIPTWPWKPGIMRGFVSAMLLPIALWIIQQVLEGLLVF